MNKDSSHLNVPDIKVTLPGTGSPPLMEQFGPSAILKYYGLETHRLKAVTESHLNVC